MKTLAKEMITRTQIMLMSLMLLIVAGAGAGASFADMKAGSGLKGILGRAVGFVTMVLQVKIRLLLGI